MFCWIFPLIFQTKDVKFHTHNKLIFICRQGHLSAPLPAAQMHICNLSEINTEDYSKAQTSIHTKQMRAVVLSKFLHFQNVSQVGGGDNASVLLDLDYQLHLMYVQLNCPAGYQCFFCHSMPTRPK